MTTNSLSAERLEEFKAVTHADDTEAQFYLEASHGNLERAINMYAAHAHAALLAFLPILYHHRHDTLSTTYGDEMPSFVEATWREALGIADSQQKMLCVYLHAPDHVAMQVLACVEGYCEPGVLLSTMVSAVEASSAMLSQARQAQSERDFARRLREEQDAALEASMRADREREAQRQSEAAAAKEAEAQAQRGEEALRAAEEAARRSKQDRSDAIAARRVQKATSLSAEPAAGADATLLRVRLPNGAMSQRRFSVSDSVARVYDFVDALEDLAALDYLLACTFPRREFPRETAADVTLQDAGLVPNAALMVTNLDD